MTSYKDGITALGLILSLDNNCLNHGYYWRRTYFVSRNIDWHDKENDALPKYQKPTRN